MNMPFSKELWLSFCDSFLSYKVSGFVPAAYNRYIRALEAEDTPGALRHFGELTFWVDLLSNRIIAPVYIPDFVDPQKDCCVPRIAEEIKATGLKFEKKLSGETKRALKKIFGEAYNRIQVDNNSSEDDLHNSYRTWVSLGSLLDSLDEDSAQKIVESPYWRKKFLGWGRQLCIVGVSKALENLLSEERNDSLEIQIFSDLEFYHDRYLRIQKEIDSNPRGVFPWEQVSDLSADKTQDTLKHLYRNHMHKIRWDQADYLAYLEKGPIEKAIEGAKFIRRKVKNFEQITGTPFDWVKDFGLRESRFNERIRNLCDRELEGAYRRLEAKLDKPLHHADGSYHSFYSSLRDFMKTLWFWCQETPDPRISPWGVLGVAAGEFKQALKDFTKTKPGNELIDPPLEDGSDLSLAKHFLDEDIDFCTLILRPVSDTDEGKRQAVVDFLKRVWPTSDSEALRPEPQPPRA